MSQIKGKQIMDESLHPKKLTSGNLPSTVVIGSDLTIEQLDSAGDKALVTKGYVDNAILNIEATTEKTYAEIVAMAAAGQLEAGQYYAFDYQATYFQDYTGVNKTGSVEKLIVQAATPNTIIERVISDVYPNDIIYYTLNRDNEYTVPNGHTGVIYYREDTKKGNSAYFCFWDVGLVLY